MSLLVISFFLKVSAFRETVHTMHRHRLVHVAMYKRILQIRFLLVCGETASSYIDLSTDDLPEASLTVSHMYQPKKRRKKSK